MPQLPVQSSNPLAAVINGAPQGTRAEAGAKASDSPGSFSGMLKKEMARSEPVEHETSVKATEKPAAQESGTPSAASESQDPAAPGPKAEATGEVSSSAEAALDPGVVELIALLTAAGQPAISSDEGIPSDADASKGMNGTGSLAPLDQPANVSSMPQALVTAHAAPQDSVESTLEPESKPEVADTSRLPRKAAENSTLETESNPVPADTSRLPLKAAENSTLETESNPVPADTSRLPLQAAEPARTGHSGASEAANSAGRPLPEQAISGEGRTGDQASGPRSSQDFAALVEHASTALGVTPTGAQASMAREVGHSFRIEAPPGQPARWAQEIGDRVAWMVTSREQRAELVLNPPQLGRIEVTLAVNGDQANAWFSSPNSTVRELLETSLPRLREVMSEAGIQLGQAQVGADTPGFAPRGEEQRPDSGSGARNRVEESGYVRQPVTSVAVSAGRGMVDIFA